jgi:proteic killer suppression protein
MLKTIATFKDKDAHDFFFGKRIKKWEKITKLALLKLTRLNAVVSLEELVNRPGNFLHKLKGDRKGQWAITIKGAYRICFYWKNGKAHEVEIVDYH